MGFTPDGSAMYYTDSGKREIYLFDYDRDSGAITKQRLFVRTPEGEGVPDGLTVDAEGFVLSARWGGGCVVRYTPEAFSPCASVPDVFSSAGSNMPATTHTDSRPRVHHAHRSPSRLMPLSSTSRR